MAREEGEQAHVGAIGLAPEEDGEHRLLFPRFRLGRQQGEGVILLPADEAAAEVAHRAPIFACVGRSVRRKSGYARAHLRERSTRREREQDGETISQLTI